ADEPSILKEVIVDYSIFVEIDAEPTVQAVEPSTRKKKRARAESTYPDRPTRPARPKIIVNPILLQYAAARFQQDEVNLQLVAANPTLPITEDDLRIYAEIDALARIQTEYPGLRDR